MGDEYKDLTRRISKIKEPEKQPTHRRCSAKDCGNFADIITDTNCLCGQHYQLAADRRGISAHVLAVRKSGNEQIKTYMRDIFKRFQAHRIMDNTKYHLMKRR